MPEHAFEVTLTLCGPILTASSVTQEIGLDAPAAKRKSDGKLYLPGSLMRGKVREQAAYLSLNQLGALFGSASANPENDEPNAEPIRSKVFFSDFVDLENRPSARRTRISIDHDRGAVDEQMLLILESPYEAGDRVKFTGTLRFFSEQADRAAIELELQAALRAVSSAGSQRTVGFGRVEKVEFAPARPVAANQVRATGETLGLALSTQDLICVAKAQPAGNLFESSQILPGNAIKGAIATTWLLSLGKPTSQPIDGNTDPKRGELGRVFSEIRFRHARAVKAGATVRPQAIPLSAVRWGKEWKDTALLPGDPGKWQEVPRFQPDWKDDNPSALFGQVQVPVELRVRTKIDGHKRRAEDQDLFAYEMLCPGGEYKFLSCVDFPDGAPPQASAQLQDLLARGIDAFGKTKARLQCRFVSEGAKPQQTPQLRGGVYVIALQTPALLNDPRQYNQDLYADYRGAWSELSEHCLEMSQFRARQELAGGFYQQRRFAPGRPYRPWLLTQAGSVFVLSPAPGRETEASRKIGDWLRGGLPLPAAVAEFYGLDNRGEDWQRCPYIRQNGFGEIGVNHDFHWKQCLDAVRGEE